METKAEAEAEAKATRRARRCSRPIGRQKKKLRGESGNRTPDHFHPKEVSYHFLNGESSVSFSANSLVKLSSKI